MKDKTIYSPHTEQPFEHDSLLPCPCCGGDADLIFIGNQYTKSRKVTIKCKNCRLQRTDAAIKNGSEWIAKIAIDYWNNRA